MKFVCQHCNAKYTIRDEKVRKPLMKVRCKHCAGTIQVRVPADLWQRLSANAAGAKKSSRIPDSKAESGTTSSLADKFAKSFDKSPKKETSQKASGLLNTLKQASKTSQEITEQDETDLPHWFVAIDDKPKGPISLRQLNDHFRGGRVTDTSLVWKEGMGDWTPLRNILEIVNLLARIDRERKEPKQTPNIGVPFPTQPGNVPEEEPVAQLNAPEPMWGTELESDMGGLRSLTPPKAAGNRVYLLASVGFFITALATLGVVLFGGSQATGDPQPVRTVEKIVEKVVYRDRIVEKERPHANADSTTTSAARKISPGGMRKARAKTGGEKADGNAPGNAKTRALMERMGVSTPSNRSDLGSRSAAAGSSAGKAKSGSLSAGQMQAVVNRNRSSLKSCYERSLRKGEASADRDVRVNFKMTIGSSGTVKRVSLGGAVARLPTLKACLDRSVRKWVFPPSAGESKLEFPFVFTPTG